MNNVMTDVNVKSKLTTITPELAKKWLDSNTSNRPIRIKNLHFIMQQLKSGAWVLNNDAICFDVNGIVLNGQHRLWACVNTGISFECFVTRGLDPKSFNVMDIGGTRTAGDIFGANQIDSPKLKSSIVRFILDYRFGRVLQNGTKAAKTSNQAVLDFYEKHARKIDEATTIAQDVYKHHHLYSSNIIGGFAYIFNEIDKDVCLVFMEQFAKGENLSAHHPILTLRTQLMNDAQSKTKYPKSDKLAWMIIAWNNYRAGKKIKRIVFKENEKFPKAI